MYPTKKRFSSTSEYTMNMVRSIANIDAIDVEPTLEQATPTTPEEIKIPLQEAIASKRFIDNGYDIFKEADTETTIGGVWLKKEIIDEKTGEKQEWLVAYTNDDMDVEKRLIESSLKKVAQEDPFGVNELKQNQEGIDNSLEGLDMPELEDDTPDFARIPSYGDSEIMDSVGHTLGIDSYVTNDFGKHGKVVDIFGPHKVLVRWDDAPYEDQDGGDTISPTDLVVVGSLNKVGNEEIRTGLYNLRERAKALCLQHQIMEDTIPYMLLDTLYHAEDADTEELQELLYPSDDSLLYDLKNKEVTVDNALGDGFNVPTNEDFEARLRSLGSQKTAASREEVQHILTLLEVIAPTYKNPEDAPAITPQAANIIANWYREEEEDIARISPRFLKDDLLALRDAATDFSEIKTVWPNYSIDEEDNDDYIDDGVVEERFSIPDTGEVRASQKKAFDYRENLMKGYVKPLPELVPGDRVEDTRTNNIGLVKDIQGDLVEVDMGTHSMKVPISAINKLSYHKTANLTDIRMQVIEILRKMEFGENDPTAFPQESDIANAIAMVTNAQNLNELRQSLDNAFPGGDITDQIFSKVSKLKIAGQPKPQDIPIAPGIKSKNITMDETGGQGTAKVTIEFSNVDQGLKFYQEQAGATQQAPEPKKEEAPAQPQGQPPVQNKPVQGPALPTPGPGLTPASSLKFADYGGEEISNSELYGDEEENWNRMQDTPDVGSYEWVSKVLKEADEYYARAHVVPDEEDLIGYIHDIAEDEGGYCDDEMARDYYRSWQKGFNKQSLGSADEIHTTIRIKRVLEEMDVDEATAAQFATDVRGEWQEYIELPDEAIYEAYQNWKDEAGPQKMTEEDWDQRGEEDAFNREQFGSKKFAYEDTDMLPGGKADNEPNSDFNKEQLNKGIKVEMGEHTDDREIASEIAKDHLTEMPDDYYDKLNAMEKGGSLKLGWKSNTNPTIWNVKARSFDKESSNPLADARWEEINTNTNKIFSGCKTADQVKKRYEAFWSMDKLSTEVVKVEQVVPIK